MTPIGHTGQKSTSFPQSSRILEGTARHDPAEIPIRWGFDLEQLESHLMQRIAAGDENAVAELYDRFGGLVFRVARQLLPTNQEAEDAVQEIFVRLWQTAERFDPQRAKLVTWVMLIARRHLIDQLRRKSVRPKSPKEVQPVKKLLYLEMPPLT